LNTTLVTFDANLITGVGTATPATTCHPTTGAATSAAGKGFNVIQTNRSVNAFFTTANDADGIQFVTPNITVNFATVLPAGGAYTAGELKTSESVSVIYQVQIN